MTRKGAGWEIDSRVIWQVGVERTRQTDVCRAIPQRMNVVWPLGDGSSWIWTAWDRHFQAFGFVPILNFIHALTRVYAAALAGRSKPEGWKIYERWITWVWQGEVTKVIAPLAQRQQVERLGLSSPWDRLPACHLPEE